MMYRAAQNWLVFVYVCVISAVSLFVIRPHMTVYLICSHTRIRLICVFVCKSGRRWLVYTVCRWLQPPGIGYFRSDTFMLWQRRRILLYYSAFVPHAVLAIESSPAGPTAEPLFTLILELIVLPLPCIFRPLARHLGILWSFSRVEHFAYVTSIYDGSCSKDPKLVARLWVTYVIIHKCHIWKIFIHLFRFSSCWAVFDMAVASSDTPVASSDNDVASLDIPLVLSHGVFHSPMLRADHGHLC